MQSWYEKEVFAFLLGVAVTYLGKYFGFRIHQLKTQHDKHVQLIRDAREGIYLASGDSLNPEFLKRQWYQEIRQHLNPKIYSEVESPENQLVLEMGSASPIKSNYRLNLVHEEVSRLAKKWKIQ